MSSSVGQAEYVDTMHFERDQGNKKEISRIRQPLFIIFEIVIVIFDTNHDNVSHISIQTLQS